MQDRIKQLEEFLKEDPNDSFTLYALALELIKVDRSKAVSVFQQLIEQHGNYLPAYYQLAELYETLGAREKAVATYEIGIQLARKQNDLKTLQELRSALENLE